MAREYPRVPMEDRFWAKVDRRGDDECWPWLGGLGCRGYGKIAIPGPKGSIRAHRYSAMLHFGMFDSRLLVCHTCDNPACVNPSHLFLDDALGNNRDREDKGRHPHPVKDECKNGHPMEGDNVGIISDGGGRIRRRCRACDRESTRRYKARTSMDDR